MKKITFLVASIFLFGGGIANATEKNNFSHERRLAVDFRNAEPIVFVERGVEFFVFPDGQFDFNTRPSTSNDVYHRSGRSSAVNRTYGAPSSFRNGNYGVKVEHDNFGRVRRIGNVFVNYDSNDRIKRIGSVYMSYNRFALEQIGGLQIIYNRRGQIIDMVGNVKGGRGSEYSQNNNGSYDYGNSQNSNDQDYGNNQNTNDQDQYYFKSTGTKTKDSKISGSLDIRVDKR
ncbi:hypothetical protein [Flavobacterium sp. K5-23]|uniref:hypothetical protein n=1 Tax=Flavobacterium sp. K5-23 TaxID=2746225 RepID=UPI00200E29FB|nr:hypothetical protein [Flavobacterium sp. K5-23]UQD55736.1 hypothetical protein FLAK523_04730 [Flavobacterium sp. K5-23]